MLVRPEDINQSSLTVTKFTHKQPFSIHETLDKFYMYSERRESQVLRSSLILSELSPFSIYDGLKLVIIWHV